MNDSQNGADPFGWFEQIRLGHRQFATLMHGTLGTAPLDERSKARMSARRPFHFNQRRFA